MRKLHLLIALAAALALPCAAAPAALPALAAEAAEGWHFNGGIKWKVEDKKLIISAAEEGKCEKGYEPGIMTNDESGYAPWFQKCTGVEEVYLDSDVRNIVDAAFCNEINKDSNFNSLKKVTGGEGLESIGRRAFRKCTNLTEMFTIGPNVTSIGEGAFAETGIKEFAVAEGNKTITCRGEGSPDEDFKEGVVLYGKNEEGDRLLLACAPKAKGDFRSFQADWLDSVGEIGAYAFYGVSFDGEAKDLMIPDTVKAIGENAFKGCEWLRGNLTIPDSVEEVGDQAFAGCSYLRSSKLTLGSGLRSVGENAFDGPGFTELDWKRAPVGTTIGSNAFRTCQFTSLVLPEGVAEVRNQAFNSYASPIVLPKSLVTLDDQSIFVGENTVLYVSNEAQANIYSGRVRVHLNGGTVDLTEAGNAAALEESKLPTPTRAGYMFKGWYKTENLTGDKVEPGTVLEDGETYYAKWTSTDVGDATVTVSLENSVYDGNPKDPSVEVKLGGATLKLNTDYELSYSNSNGGGDDLTNAGTVTVTGTGAYKGEARAEFTIVPAQLVVQLPSASGITYGEELSKSALTSDMDSEYGTFEWVDGTQKPNAGTYTAQVEFVPNRMTERNYTGYEDKRWGVDVVVGAASLTVTAKNKQVTYREAKPEFGEDDVEIKRFVNGDGPSDLEGSLTLACGYEVGAGAGETFPITPGGLRSKNYDITFKPGKLTVGKAPIAPGAPEATKEAPYHAAKVGDLELPANWKWAEADAGYDLTQLEVGGTTAATAVYAGLDAGNYETEVVEVTITRLAAPYVPPAPSATETTVTKNPDGSTTTTVRDRETGKETVTREYREGVRVVTVREPGAEPRATVTLPSGVSPFLVTLPVDATEATVAAYAGTREAINRCAPTEDGLAVLVTRSCELVAFDNARPFSDMSGHWAQGAVDFASARGLMNGIGGTGTFEPDTHTSRAMVCAVLSNLEYGPEATKGPAFADTASDAWYAKAVSWAAEVGIVHGYGDGSTFGPGDDVTREQMACMVFNYARAMGMDTTKRADLSEYKDADDLTYGREAMEWCVASGVFHGYDGGEELGATDGLTRAQCAAVLMNLVTLIVLG